MGPLRKYRSMFWHNSKYWLGIILLGIYASAIIFDLPRPAGAKFQQDLPNKELINWGAIPTPSALHASHWWQKTQGLRGWSANPEGWVWPRVVPISNNNWFIALGIGLLGAFLLLWAERLKNQRKISLIVIILLIIFGYSFQLVMLRMKNSNAEQLLVARISDKDFTGYFQSSLQFDRLSDYFSGYSATLHDPLFCSHCKTHPPGPVLYYWLLHRLIDLIPASGQATLAQTLEVSGQIRSEGLQPDGFLVAWFGANLILLVTSTIVIPLYGLARRFGTLDLSLPLIALGLVIPGLILMSPEFDQVYAVFSAWLLFLAVRGLETPKHVLNWGLIAGLVLAYSLYWSFGLLVIIFPLVLVGFIALSGKLPVRPNGSAASQNRIQLLDLAKWLLGLVLGCVIPWVLLVGFGKFPLFAMLKAIRNDHLHGITAVRPYFPWLFLNLTDFLQFLGLPIVFMTLATMFFRHRQVGQEGSNSEPVGPMKLKSQIWLRAKQFISSVNVFDGLFWLTIIALDLSGSTRGEVGRIWIFLMPLALLPIYASAGQGQINKSHIHILLLAQFFICLLIGGFWLTP